MLSDIIASTVRTSTQNVKGKRVRHSNTNTERPECERRAIKTCSFIAVCMRRLNFSDC